MMAASGPGRRGQSTGRAGEGWLDTVTRFLHLLLIQLRVLSVSSVPLRTTSPQGLCTGWPPIRDALSQLIALAGCFPSFGLSSLPLSQRGGLCLPGLFPHPQPHHTPFHPFIFLIALLRSLERSGPCAALFSVLSVCAVHQGGCGPGLSSSQLHPLPGCRRGSVKPGSHQNPLPPTAGPGVAAGPEPCKGKELESG